MQWSNPQKAVLALIAGACLVSCVEPPPPRFAPRRDIRVDELFPPDEDPAPPLRELPSDVSPPPKKEYPLAERTENPNQVLSPYEPFNTIDITGFKPGALARDPSNQKIFRVP